MSYLFKISFIKRNDRWLKKKVTQNNPELFPHCSLGENLIKTITTKSHQGELRIWRGRKLTEVGSLPGTDTEAVSTHLVPHPTQGRQAAGSRRRPRHSSQRHGGWWERLSSGLLNHPRNNWVTASQPRLSEDLAYYCNWSHLDYPSSKTQWLKLGCGSELEHFPSTLQALCFIPALQEKKCIQVPWLALKAFQ